MSILSLLPIGAAARLGIEAVRQVGENFAQFLNVEPTETESGSGKPAQLELSASGTAVRAQLLRQNAEKKLAELTQEIAHHLESQGIPAEPPIQLALEGGGFTAPGHPSAQAIEEWLNGSPAYADAVKKLADQLAPPSLSSTSTFQFQVGGTDLAYYFG